MELRRKFYDFLMEWKTDHSKECLLVKGARQIGKTYIIEKFGRENYESFIEKKVTLPHYMVMFLRPASCLI